MHEQQLDVAVAVAAVDDDVEAHPLTYGMTTPTTTTHLQHSSFLNVAVAAAAAAGGGRSHQRRRLPAVLSCCSLTMKRRTGLRRKNTRRNPSQCSKLQEEL